MLPILAVVAIAIGAVFVLLYQGVALLLGAQMPKLDPAPADGLPVGGTTVGVVIAARNEAEDLPGTLDALLAQEYPALDIVVVDGRSTDGTRAVIEARAPRVRRVEEPPLPAGWMGKNWACWNGASAVRGDWLLFLDADVRLSPAAIRTVLAWAQRESADLASVGVRIETVGFWERVVLPFFLQIALVYFRVPRTNRPASRAAFANGQFWTTPRATYERVGGHAAVAGRVNEDVAMARRYRAAGLRLRIAWAPQLGWTRMYRDRHEMFEGLLKNTRDSDFTGPRDVAQLVALLAFFILPLAVLPVGLATGTPWVVGIGVLLYGALFAKHVVFTAVVRGVPAYGLLFLLAVGFYLVLFATSLVEKLRKRPVRWKGRAYPAR